MNLITRQDNANKSAKEWKARYFHPIAKHWQYGAQEKERTYHELVSLGSNPNPDDVDKIIGNSSWTENMCQVCGEKVEETIRFEKIDDYEYSAIRICRSCIEKAILKFQRR